MERYTDCGNCSLATAASQEANCPRVRRLYSRPPAQILATPGSRRTETIGDLMKKAVLLAALCSVVFVSCLNTKTGPTAKSPKITEGRATMAKIGGRPLPVFEFSAKVDDEDNKIVAARAFVSITGALYKQGEKGYNLVEPKPLEAEYIANVGQVRVTVDPAKEEALATHLNGEAATVAFQVEVDWTAPDSTEKQTTRSMIFESDHDTIATAGLAKEIK